MQQVSIIPHWGGNPQEFRHTWSDIGNVDNFRWLVRGDMHEQLRIAHEELGMKHVRAVGIFSPDTRVWQCSPVDFQTPKEQRVKKTNYQIIDYCLDSILDTGVKPMFTTCFMPDDFAADNQHRLFDNTNCAPPRDLHGWENFVRDVMLHMKSRYGVAELRSWFFEVWNEPNLLGSFWRGTKEEWFKVWLHTCRAIKSVDADFRIGGPSTARAEWLDEFLDFARKNECEPDFVIAHIYNNDSDLQPLSPFDGPASFKVKDSPHFASGVIKGTRKLLDSLSFKGEVHWNEWGRSWFPHDPLRETPLEAAFIVKTMAEVSQEADQFSYWCLSDIYDQAGYTDAEFCGHYGMLSLHSLRKPSYMAHQLLGRLGTKRVRSEGGNELSGAIAVEDGGRRQCLVYLYPGKINDSVTEAKVSITLPGQPETAPSLFRISSTENNIVKEWRNAGAPQYPAREQILELRTKNNLSPAPESAVSIINENGTWKAVFDLDIPGVALLEDF